MKKLLTLFTLLLTVCSGAWGETVVWESDMQETITGVTQTKSRANDSWSTGLNFSWAPGYTNGFQYTGSGTLTISYNTPLELQKGDVIRFYAGATNSTARTLSLYINSGASVDASVSLPQGSLRVLDYKITEDVTLNSIRVGSNNKDTYLFKAIILRDTPAEGSTTISYSFTRSSMDVQGYTNNFISTISGLSSAITLSNLTTDNNNGQASLSGNITGQQVSESESYYADLQFTVADGYTFNPSEVNFKWAGSSTSLKAKISIIDATTTVNSNESTIPNSSVSLANATNITFADGAFTDKYFTGTVHIRIYMYGVTGKRAYLAIPFAISGTVAAAAAKKSTTTVISGAGITNTDVKTSKDAGTLTATVTPEGESALASPTIKWSSDDEDVAKVGETTGVVTLVAAGTANITATYEGDGTYAGSFDIYELDVTDSRPEIHPTLTYDNPTLILGVTTTANPSLSGNTGGAEVEYSSDNTAVATVDSELGVVTAHAVGTAHITASVAATSEYRAGSVQATITVINDPFGNHTVTWTLSPLDSSSKSLTSESVSTSTYLNNIAEINHTKVGLSDSPSKAAGRTAKVNRTAGKDADKYVYVTFNVEDGYYFIPSSIDVKVANVNNVTTFDAELVDEHDVTVSETGKTFASTDGTVETWTIENEDNGKSMSGTVTLKIYGYAETTGSYRFGNQIQISGKVVEAVPVTISDKKYATFASDRKLDFSGVEGLYAYTATVTFDELTFTKVTGSTAAEEGLLLYSETAKTYNVPVATGNPAKVSGNKLVRGEGTAVASDGEGETKNYVLSMNGAGEVNFYLANGNTVPTSKAYLKNIPVAATSKIFLPTGEDETDGIRSIENSELRIENSDYYNLAGQKVGADYKGIVIVNGKKVIRK